MEDKIQRHTKDTPPTTREHLENVTRKSNALKAPGVIVCALALITFLDVHRVDAQQHSYTGNEDHAVSLDQAVRYIHSFKANPETPSVNGGYFGRGVFEKMLSQSGCAGIRYYYAKGDSGVATLILVGVDSSGNDLYGGVLAEKTWPCPPYCSAPNPLNK